MIASGVCYSDKSLCEGNATISYLIILGHEGSEIIKKVGSHV